MSRKHGSAGRNGSVERDARRRRNAVLRRPAAGAAAARAAAPADRQPIRRLRTVAPVGVTRCRAARRRAQPRCSRGLVPGRGGRARRRHPSPAADFTCQEGLGYHRRRPRPSSSAAVAAIAAISPTVRSRFIAFSLLARAASASEHLPGQAPREPRLRGGRPDHQATPSSTRREPSTSCARRPSARHPVRAGRVPAPSPAIRREQVRGWVDTSLPDRRDRALVRCVHDVRRGEHGRARQGRAADGLLRSGLDRLLGCNVVPDARDRGPERSELETNRGITDALRDPAGSLWLAGTSTPATTASRSRATPGSASATATAAGGGTRLGTARRPFIDYEAGVRSVNLVGGALRPLRAASRS